MRCSFLLVSLIFLASCSDSKFSGNNPTALARPSGDALPNVNSDREPQTQGEPAREGEETPVLDTQKPKLSTVEGIRDACALAADRLETTTQLLYFPEHKLCNWGTAPNRTQEEALVQASETTATELKLPTGHICGIGIESAKDATLIYDDMLVLALDSQIIYVSNKDLTENLEKKNGIFTWDFNKVVGQQFVNFDGIPYCIGDESECSFPTTDKQGPVTINLASEKIAGIALTLQGKSSAPVTLTATGDNEDKDCYHSELNLTVTIKSIPQ